MGCVLLIDPDSEMKSSIGTRDRVVHGGFKILNGENTHACDTMAAVALLVVVLLAAAPAPTGTMHFGSTTLMRRPAALQRLRRACASSTSSTAGDAPSALQAPPKSFRRHDRRPLPPRLHFLPRRTPPHVPRKQGGRCGLHALRRLPAIAVLAVSPWEEPNHAQAYLSPSEPPTAAHVHARTEEQGWRSRGRRVMAAMVWASLIG
jgi:hypothetical protein